MKLGLIDDSEHNSVSFVEISKIFAMQDALFGTGLSEYIPSTIFCQTNVPA